MSLKISKITIAWALYIIISASFMRQVLSFLTNNIGPGGIRIMLGCFFLAGGAVVLFYLYKSRPPIRRIVLFLGVLTAGLFYASQMEILEEQLHLIKYGLLGWLIIKDFRNATKDILLVGLSLLFCLCVATIDETFQWWLPYRVGDIRDVGFAGVGSIWGITMFLLTEKSNK